MKHVKKTLSCILLFFIGSMNARGVGVQAQPTTQPQPIPTRITPKPVMTPQPIALPKSYAHALTIIKTQMPSNQILVNNTFTQEFINFVKSLHLSAIETKALLEAGANIHTTWTDNNETNKTILLSLKNAIQTITQTKQTKHIKPTTPTKPVRQPIRTKPIMQPTPIKKNKPLQQALPIQDHFITNNLVMTLDPERNETVDTQGGAMVQQALVALYEKAAPVIMTSNILEIIIKAKQQIGDSELQRLRAMNLQQMISQAQYLRQSRNVTTMGDLLLILLSNIDFDSNNLNCYFHKAANLVLLIPKAYIYANLPKTINFNLNDQAKVCGFNPTVLNAVTDLTADNLIKQLQVQQVTSIDRERFISHLTSMFIVQKKGGELISPDQDTPWMIYLTGHGGPAYLTIGFVREQLKMDKQSLANAKKFRVRDPNIQRWIPIWESNVKKYEKIIQTRSSWPDSQIVPESAHIAGLTAHNFAQLMKFFDNSLNTAYIHYTTCFSGGSNQSFVNETLSSLDVNFIVSSEGLHEGYTKAQLNLMMSSNKPGIHLQNQSFAEFFRLLRMFFTQPEEFVKIKGKRKDPIIKIVRTISSEAVQQNQPFVRFPGAGFFAATPLSKKTKILTKTIVKAHEIEKRPIDMSNIGLDVLVINTPRINVLLNLGNKKTGSTTAIVTPSPKNFLPGYEAINVFKEINFNNTLQVFLFNCSYLNARLYTQTFVINTLTGIFYPLSGLPDKKGSSINNLIIQMRGVSGTNRAATNQPSMQLTSISAQDLKAGTIGLNIKVAFEFNGNIYQSTFAIKDFESPKDIFKNMEKLTFTATPQQSINMNSLAGNFLTPQEIIKIAKPITLQSITQFINSKIDKQDPSMAIWAESDNEALLKSITKKARKQKQ